MYMYMYIYIYLYLHHMYVRNLHGTNKQYRAHPLC